MTIFIVTTSLLIASNSMKSYNKDNNNVIDINNNNSSSNLQYKTIIFSLLLAIQYGIQPLLASRFTSKKISKTSVVITTEFCKILIALICVLTGIIKDFKINNFDIINSLKIAAIPAFLYAIQNIFVQYGYVLLDSMTFNVLNQTKTLSSAIFLFIILGLKQSIIQIISLGILLIAACMLSVKNQAVNSNIVFDSGYKTGIILVSLASLLSGLSTALTQKALIESDSKKGRKEPILFSAELASYGILFLIISSLFQHDGYKMITNGFFHEWNMTTFIPVITNSFGGVIVGLVTKYGGGIVKGFALIIGIVITAFVQWIIENKPLKVLDWIAVVLVSISIYLHSNYQPKKVISNKEK